MPSTTKWVSLAALLVAAADCTATEAKPERPTTAARASTIGSLSAAVEGSKPVKDEPGFLTIVCSPECDDVSDQGRSLGPPPIVHLSVAPGAHRLTGRRGKESKTISAVVTSGQLTTGTIPMK